MNAALSVRISKTYLRMLAVFVVLGAATVSLLQVWGLPLLIKYYTFLHGAVLVRPH